MTTDVFRRLKEKSKSPKELRDEVAKDIDSIMNNDESFFDALLQFGEALRFTLHKGKEQTEDEMREAQFVYINMVYTMLKAFDASGFVKIIPKVDRIVDNAIEDYKRSL